MSCTARARVAAAAGDITADEDDSPGDDDAPTTSAGICDCIHSILSIELTAWLTGVDAALQPPGDSRGAHLAYLSTKGDAVSSFHAHPRSLTFSLFLTNSIWENMKRLFGWKRMRNIFITG